MADEQNKQQEPEDTTDYKALYEQAKSDADKYKADADKWKAQSRKNESRAKANAGAASELDDATKQLAEISARLTKIEGENEALKADAERAELVAKVAKETGVPEAIVTTLAGNDEDTLTEAAKAIAGIMPHGAPSAPEAGTFPRGTDAAPKNNAKRFGELVGQMLSQ